MTMKTHMLKPFFGYYGAKKMLGRRYPTPQHDTIIEPFAGSACYATRYPDRKVLLVEKNPIVAGVWAYLITTGPEEIRALPDVPEGGTIRDIAVCEEAQNLIGFWLDAGVSSPRPRPCKRMRNLRPGRGDEGSYWGDRARARIARQVDSIRHWRVLCCGYEDLPVARKQATWFVDPPYQGAGKHYTYADSGVDFAHLAAWCRSLNGQVIVCENMGANWLPFRDLGADLHNHHTGGAQRARREAIWTNEDGT